jgi:hypothetical protein
MLRMTMKNMLTRGLLITVIFPKAMISTSPISAAETTLSDFSQTLKLYTHHLSQYQFVGVLRFLFHWCNHWCHFVLQNMTLLVNFDLTLHKSIFDHVSITL